MVTEHTYECVFYLDTDSYSGNFGRDWMSYVTGKGYADSDYAPLAWKDAGVDIEDGDEDGVLFGLPEMVFHMDGYGAWHLLEDMPNYKGKGTCCRSVSITFTKELSPVNIQVIKERSIKFFELYNNQRYVEKVKITGYRVINRKTETTIEESTLYQETLPDNELGDI